MKLVFVCFLFISSSTVKHTVKKGLIESKETSRLVRKTRFKFTITLKELNQNFPAEIFVEIENNDNIITLHNFILNIYSNNDSYWGINEDFRFLKKNPLTLKENSIFEKTIKLESFKFKSMKTNEFKSLKEVKETLMSGREYRIVATITDPSRSKNPYESNLSVRSSMITVKTE